MHGWSQRKELDYDSRVPGIDIPKICFITARVVKEWRTGQAVRGDSTLGVELAVPKQQWEVPYPFVEAPAELLSKTFQKGEVVQEQPKEEEVSVTSADEERYDEEDTAESGPGPPSTQWKSILDDVETSERNGRNSKFATEEAKKQEEMLRWRMKFP